MYRATAPRPGAGPGQESDSEGSFAEACEQKRVALVLGSASAPRRSQNLGHLQPTTPDPTAPSQPAARTTPERLQNRDGCRNRSAATAWPELATQKSGGKASHRWRTDRTGRRGGRIKTAPEPARGQASMPATLMSGARTAQHKTPTSNPGPAAQRSGAYISRL